MLGIVCFSIFVALFLTMAFVFFESKEEARD